MSVPISAPELLSRDFLEVRAKILELAACLDRFQRAEGSVEGDPRMRRIAEGLRLLQSADQPDRAEFGRLPRGSRRRLGQQPTALPCRVSRPRLADGPPRLSGLPPGAVVLVSLCAVRPPCGFEQDLSD